MIDHGLTPNEMAKLELFDTARAVLYDGAQHAHPNMTDREAAATDAALSKLQDRLYDFLGMAKINAKAGRDW